MTRARLHENRTATKVYADLARKRGPLYAKTHEYVERAFKRNSKARCCCSLCLAGAADFPMRCSMGLWAVSYTHLTLPTTPYV